MALIKLTPDDIKRGMPWANGWYKAVIESTEITESKDKKSMHYTPTYRITEHDDPDTKDRTLGGVGFTNFNSGAMGRIVPLLAALENLTVPEFQQKTKEKGLEFDFHSLKGKVVQIKIEMSDNGSGGLAPKVTGFLPYDDKPKF